jgi:hypothetical protein
MYSMFEFDSLQTRSSAPSHLPCDLADSAPSSVRSPHFGHISVDLFWFESLSTWLTMHMVRQSLINDDCLDPRPLLLLIFHLVLDMTELNGARDKNKK